MKKFSVLLIFMTVIVFAIPAFADEGVDAPAEETSLQTDFDEAASCPECVKKKSCFQKMNDSIKDCCPKPWLLRPMKPFEPVKKDRFPYFQKLADSISKKCPSQAKRCGCQRCR